MFKKDRGAFSWSSKASIAVPYMCGADRWMSPSRSGWSACASSSISWLNRNMTPYSWQMRYSADKWSSYVNTYMGNEIFPIDITEALFHAWTWDNSKAWRAKLALWYLQLHKLHQGKTNRFNGLQVTLSQNRMVWNPKEQTSYESKLSQCSYHLSNEFISEVNRGNGRYQGNFID